MSNHHFIKDALLGVATGDALGVPVEFRSRRSLAENPVTDMRAYGTHGQPAGTWSDDTSLTFCLAEMLCGDYDLRNLATRFVNWKYYAYWTPHATVFDIGFATSEAIERLQQNIPPVLAGGDGEYSNGNGSLMRILPLLFYIKDMPVEERFRHTKDVSSLTHRHLRSVNGCFIYLEMARAILQGETPQQAYQTICKTVPAFLSNEEMSHYERTLSGKLADCQEDDIRGSGYVVSCLEAAIWCLLHTSSYAGAVLKAVNLGEDTDTTAAVTGGLAGLTYGWTNIPGEWLNVLAKREAIDVLIANLQAKIYS
ncbi:ADP-ribosylglycohydrolase family protein [Chitinophaga rhizophila]|uniref:ADP-ribosylglycohydrolase family protein n=1 Tax=Chitinophaga rhizophila TaxID=2866212 RepID=A0ABS7GMJ8_9BACT|nr:ADP-ribosylglycohydrolase family protein [Chitinophaga rhizophila]MBW8688199.1 ADP-ribosylglycohydrolase family protein [Chitinophaga rhizophila]